MRASAHSSYRTRSRGSSSELNRRHRTSVDSARGRCCRGRLRAAYGTGEASALAPFEYFRLPFAMVYGTLLFAELPDLYTLLGASIIVPARSTSPAASTSETGRSRRAACEGRAASAPGRSVPVWLGVEGYSAVRAGSGLEGSVVLRARWLAF